MIDETIEIPIGMYENDGNSVDECRGTLDVAGAEDEVVTTSVRDWGTLEPSCEGRLSPRVHDELHGRL